MPQWTVDATDPAVPVVTVGGVAQTGVSRVSVDIAAAGMPTLYLEFAGQGAVTGVGEVVVRQPPVAALLDVLDGLDPDEVEAVAARSMEWGASPGKVFLAAVRQLVGQA